MGSHARHGLLQIADILDEDPDGFTQRVYARLFVAHPELREAFPANLAEHRELLLQVVTHTMRTLPTAETHEELIELLAQLGRDQRKFGMTDAHYDTLRDALYVQIIGAVGAERLDDDDYALVDHTATMITGVMRGAAQSDPTPARRAARVVEVLRPQRDLTIVRLIAGRSTLWRAGQYIETQIPQLPRYWRPFSIAMPPNTHGHMEFHIRATRGGWVSRTIAAETAPGDVWQFGQIHGTLRVDGDRPATLVAGGTGLAPMKSILMQMSISAENPHVHLIVGAQSPGALYDSDALSTLAATNPWLTVTQVTEERRDPWWMDRPAPPHRALRLRHGTVVDAIAGLDLRGQQVLIAGPPEMIHAAGDAAVQAGAKPHRIQHDPLRA
ncbi:FAD-binding oxidoreductase [Tsukamurella sp. 8F]|uniref:FAD-binding oxidoreductase n=1 Tax=unclassified Tsukamurella TaxID=2633480 RepID=UPI0023B92F14|nr:MULTISPECIES: FAD-binding oxidoreductase [unclassified Tsukamurella]MDF0528538.1 FAD-binding oxidoreductase [Tsukamurella sp. 8J]MDF0586364.1 FAD-binding oxidoreductase [Tsukamurella sp. 8F]